MASDYSAGDVVEVRVPKIDRTNTSMRIMPCKVIEKTTVSAFFQPAGF